MRKEPRTHSGFQAEQRHSKKWITKRTNRGLLPLRLDHRTASTAFVRFNSIFSLRPLLARSIAHSSSERQISATIVSIRQRQHNRTESAHKLKYKFFSWLLPSQPRQRDSEQLQFFVDCFGDAFDSPVRFGLPSPAAGIKN